MAIDVWIALSREALGVTMSHVSLRVQWLPRISKESTRPTAYVPSKILTSQAIEMARQGHEHPWRARSAPKTAFGYAAAHITSRDVSGGLGSQRV